MLGRRGAQAAPRSAAVIFSVAALSSLKLVATAASANATAANQPLRAHELIVHVGPYKTASTTLEIAVHRTYRAALERLDAVSVPASLPGLRGRHKNHGNLADALMSDRPAAQPAWLAFARAARAAAAAGGRVLLSSEGLCALGAAQARLLVSSALGPLGFRAVRVIVVHRALYAKLASVHSQAFMRADLRAVADYATIAGWLAANGSAVRARFLETVRLRDTYAALGASVSVLRMEKWRGAAPANEASAARNASSPLSESAAQGGRIADDLVADFVCEHVRAPATCAGLRAGSLPRVEAANVRPRELAPLFDVLYAEARARGMQTLGGARAAVDFLAARELLGGARGLALTRRCPSARVLEALRDASEREERLLAAPAQLPAALLRALAADFERKRRGSLCAAEVPARSAAAWRAQLALALRRGAAEAAAPKPAAKLRTGDRARRQAERIARLSRPPSQ